MTTAAFHGDSKIKRKYVERVEQHRKADEIAQGVGWQSNGVTRGCCIGCLAHAYPAHEILAREWNVPEHLFHLADAIHEGLPRQPAQVWKLWPSRFTKAIAVGADLSLVWPQMAVWLLTDPKHGVRQYAVNSPDVLKATDAVAALWKRVIDGESIESLKAEFRAAAAAARAAVWAARAEAWAARAEAEEEEARTGFWTATADKLIELIDDQSQVNAEAP